MQEIISRLEQEVKLLFSADASGHDIHHLKRVLNLALLLQEKEGGDKLVVAISALLHDIHRLIQHETRRYCSPKDSLPKIKELLDKIEIPEDKKQKILHCIELHEEYDFSEGGKSARDIEALILQDADNLDAIGAVGIGRAFAFGGTKRNPLYLPEKPFDREYFDEAEEDPSTIHHFYSKLLKLKDNMNTRTARELAEGRHKFMELFLKEFLEEWEGLC
jgi:uncharacterized protein